MIAHSGHDCLHFRDNIGHTSETGFVTEDYAGPAEETTVRAAAARDYAYGRREKFVLPEYAPLVFCPINQVSSWKRNVIYRNRVTGHFVKLTQMFFLYERFVSFIVVQYFL